MFVGSSGGGGGSGGGGSSSSSSRPFEQACEAFVDALLRIVEMQNTEISLFRAVLVSLSLSLSPLPLSLSWLPATCTHLPASPWLSEMWPR